MKNTTRNVSVELRTGSLQVSTAAARIPLRKLLGFSSRINSKRGFLFVSKVLGKHYPVTPRKMAWSYRALAKLIMQQTDFAGTSLWVGMAETATGLGYGIFAAAYALGVDGSLYMQTTRYLLSGFESLQFVETHSHATDFALYLPISEPERNLFLHAEQLILMDDEISTGATFARLIAAYRTINPHLKRVLIVSLVNFASVADRQRVELSAGIPLIWISLIQGGWQFTAKSDFDADYADSSFNVVGNGACKKHLLAWPGRLGIRTPIILTDENISEVLLFLTDKYDQRPILILGTGECNPPAYILGRSLEHLGYQVIVQATTRSPIFVEADIASRLQFTDNYQDNIHNFLYNINPDHFRLIVFCHETPLDLENQSAELDFVGVIRQLHGVSAQFSYQNQHAKFNFRRP